MIGAFEVGMVASGAGTGNICRRTVVGQQGLGQLHQGAQVNTLGRAQKGQSLVNKQPSGLKALSRASTQGRVGPPKWLGGNLLRFE